MFGDHKKCSHIFSIHHKEENPPKHKGNLYLSGVEALKKPIKAEYGINCVLSIIDEWTFENYDVKENVGKNNIT